ncbi:hypothetical protein EMN46_18490, partial [Ancylomarina sp. 16SWW S1-10-2]|nr:hypothetical protein [Ancylomarina sp. 16SWW S1-10-2]
MGTGSFTRKTYCSCNLGSSFWSKDPLHVRPIAHAIWDPHFGQ